MEPAGLGRSTSNFSSSLTKEEVDAGIIAHGTTAPTEEDIARFNAELAALNESDLALDLDCSEGQDVDATTVISKKETGPKNAEDGVCPVNSIQTISNPKLDGTFCVDDKTKQISDDDTITIDSTGLEKVPNDDTFTIDDAKTQKPSTTGGHDSSPETMHNATQNSNVNHTERHHVRHHTITLAAGGINKEVTDLVNEVMAAHPDDYLEVLKRKFIEMAKEKEAKWSEEYTKVVGKTTAQYELKLHAINQEVQLEAQMRQSHDVQADPKLDFELESASRERDQFKDQVFSQCRTLTEQLRQHEFFTEKSQKYEKELVRLAEEQRSVEQTVGEIYGRYEALLREVEQQTIDIEAQIELLKETQGQDSIGMRYKVRQQEMKLNSLTQQVESLSCEKKELIEMCDELVEQIERQKIAAAEAQEREQEEQLQVHQNNQFHGHQETVDGINQLEEQEEADDEAFVDAESELSTESSPNNHNVTQIGDLGGF